MYNSYKLKVNNLQLVARSEGKIKSYESCTDIRAWSHDVAVQDRYLREWIKADPPALIIPCRCLTGCLSRMTRQNNRRATPHCHPNCKSKALLKSICNSCQAVKECLQQNEDLEKFFVEEEFESSHWPCDKFLDALKSIKMFWKIIVRNFFGINLGKSCGFQANSEGVHSVRSVARSWEIDMVQQAEFVRNLAPELCTGSCKRNIYSLTECHLSPKKSYRSCCIGDSNQITPLEQPFRKKNSKCTSVKVRQVDHGCNTGASRMYGDEIRSFKKRISTLQAKCDVQCEKIIWLQKENSVLRKSIEHVRRGCPWNASCVPESNKKCQPSATCVTPCPFQANLEKSCCSVNKTESELVITMKNGKNECFRNVSLLQVLHKTNDPSLKDLSANKPSSENEDPIEILNQVHCTVGAIVKREMCIVRERKCRPNNTEVDASFHRVHDCKSASFCQSPCSLTPDASPDSVCPRQSSQVSIIK